MHPRLRPSLSFQIALALVFGVAIGAAVGGSKAFSPLAGLLEQACGLVGFLALGWLRALAVPLIVSSTVLGGVGLEPMRSMGKLAGKTLQWIVLTSLLAVAVAVGVALLAGSNLAPEVRLAGQDNFPRWQDAYYWTGGWLGLVLVSLAFGYYRNQIEEGRGRMFTRFCQGIEEMLIPILRWTRACSALGIFFLTIPATAMCVSLVRMFPEDRTASFQPFYVDGLLTLLATLAVYTLALSLLVWWKARVNPWRLVPSLLPAILIAASGQSLEAALPLTMDALRRRAGVSNRVASVTLPLCAALHRDGMALGWASVVLCVGRSSSTFVHWTTLSYTVLAAVVVGCGLGALSGKSGLVPLLFLGVANVFYVNDFPIVLGAVIASLGGAVSVFSHACAAVIIARGEGEYWVPGPPPNPDELQELKNDLETAEG